MSEALSEGFTSLRDHLPNVAAAKDVRDSVLEHLPSRDDVDVSGLTDRLSGHKPGKRGVLAMLLGLSALVACAGALLRRRRGESSSVSPDIYTPPLPKP
jgi:hypothetical protein